MLDSGMSIVVGIQSLIFPNGAIFLRLHRFNRLCCTIFFPAAWLTTTDVLIIGAGMSGLGMAVQLVRKYNTRNFEIVEKVGDVGGTW